MMKVVPITGKTITQRRLQNFQALREAVRSEEQAIINDIEAGVAIEPGPHSVVIETLPKGSLKEKVLWVK